MGGSLRDRSSGGTLRPPSPFITPNFNVGRQVVGVASPATTLTFKNQSSQTLTLFNVATTGEFSQTNTCPSILSKGASCDVNVTFTPNGTASRTGTLVFTDSDIGSPQITHLTGTGTFVSLTTPSSFGTVTYGATSSRTVTLTNTAKTALTISQITTRGPFTQVNNCGSSVGAQSHCQINVHFVPVSSGILNGDLIVKTSDGAGPLTVGLEGTGQIIALVPSQLTFASQPVGTTSSAQTVQVTNPRTTDSLIMGPITSSGDFAVTHDCPQTLAPAASCTISVTFSPTQTGTRTGLISVVSSDFRSPQAIPVRGTGE